MSEIQIQANIFQYFWNNHPETRGLIFHVPNGGKRNKFEAQQLKASGVIAGIPDLIILPPFNSMIGVELKTETGRLSKEQQNIHSIWESAGYIVKTFYNQSEATQFIKQQFEII